MSLPAPTQRQARLIWLAITGLAIALLIALAVALLWGLSQVTQILSPVLWPLAIAGIIACLLDPAVDLIERKGAARPRAIAAVFGIALLVVAALFGSIVPQLVNETGQLADRIPAYAARLTERVEFWISHPPPWVQKLIERESNPATTPARAVSTNENVPLLTTNGPPANAVAQPAPEQGLLEAALGTGKLQTAAGWLAGVLRRAGVWLFGHVASWFGILAGLALIPVYTFYFILEKRGISSRSTDYLPVSDSAFKTEL